MDCYEKLLEELELIYQLTDALADEHEAVRKYDRILKHELGMYIDKKRPLKPDLKEQIEAIKQDELRHISMLRPFIEKFTKAYATATFRECLYDRTTITQGDREQATVSRPSYKKK